LLGVGVGVVDEELGVWVIGGHSIVESIVKFENAVLYVPSTYQMFTVSPIWIS
jgi:hypothetical protein